MRPVVRGGSGSVALTALLVCLMAAAAVREASSSSEFVNNVPDVRCKRRGQFLTHPYNRCKYVVCEFGSGSGGYHREKMYARVMPCAPGTAVPLHKYARAVVGDHGLKDAPCTQHFSGKCSDTAPASNYGGSYGGYSTSRRRGSSSFSHGGGGGGYRGRYSGAAYHHSSRHHPAPPRSSSYRRPSGHGYSHHRVYGKSAAGLWRRTPSSSSSSSSSSRPLTTTTRLHLSDSNIPDVRCKKVGQFLTHPTSRCKYVVCEFHNDSVAAGVKSSSASRQGYVREMPCPPGTAVSLAFYLVGNYGLTSLPCTPDRSGHCLRGPPY